VLLKVWASSPGLVIGVQPGSRRTLARLTETSVPVAGAAAEPVAAAEGDAEGDAAADAAADAVSDAVSDADEDAVADDDGADGADTAGAASWSAEPHPASRRRTATVEPTAGPTAPRRIIRDPFDVQAVLPRRRRQPHRSRPSRRERARFRRRDHREGHR